MLHSSTPFSPSASSLSSPSIASLMTPHSLSCLKNLTSSFTLPVLFNQAVWATTPFFTAVFAHLMTLKREGWLTYVTFIPVVTGVIIASGVPGTAKGAIAVVVSIHIFRNLVSITGMSGWTLTIIGIVLYNEAKKQSK
ncbi:TPT domain-containing protein [Citrus sinensis]|nr:TPT domain-containing protein [Citrus sinensis]